MILRNATQFFFIIFLINSLQISGSTKSPQLCGTPRAPSARKYGTNTPTYSSPFLRIKQEDNKSTNARFFTQIPYNRQQNNE